MTANVRLSNREAQRGTQERISGWGPRCQQRELFTYLQSKSQGEVLEAPRALPMMVSKPLLWRKALRTSGPAPRPSSTCLWGTQVQPPEEQSHKPTQRLKHEGFHCYVILLSFCLLFSWPQSVHLCLPKQLTLFKHLEEGTSVPHRFQGHKM